MPFSGSTFNRLFSWVADAGAGIKIRSDRMDQEFDNVKGGLEACLLRSGANSPTANIPMGGFRFTGLSAGQAAGDSLRYEQLFTGPMFRRNLLRNSAFNIWQSGSSIISSVANAVRTADCWWHNRSGSAGTTVSQQAGDVSRFALRMQRDFNNGLLAIPYIGQSLETQECIWMAKQQPNMVLSFWARKGADFSAVGSTILVEVYSATGTDENLLSLYTGATLLLAQNITLTNATTRYTTNSFAIPPNCNELGFRISFTPTGVAAANDWIQLEQVQLEVVSVANAPATDFARPPKFEEELFECQRYFYKTFPPTTAPAQNSGVNGALMFPQTVGATTAFAVPLPAPNHMRIAGNVTTYNPSAANAQIRNTTINADCTLTTASSNFQRPYATFTSPGASAAANILAVHYTVADPTL